MSINVKTLLGKNNLDFSISCLRSFVENSQTPIRLTILDDGSLTTVETERLHQAFEDCKIVTRQDRDSIIQQKLKNYPTCARYREEVIFAHKIFDAMLYDEEDLIFIDSDVYFKKRYTWPDFNGIPTFMMGRQHAYSFTHMEFLKVKYPIFPYVNTGMIYCPRKQFDLDFIEEVLNDKIINKGIGRISWLEQTMWSFIAAKAGAIRYFDPYQVVMAGGDLILKENTLAVHLVSAYRGEYKLLIQEDVKNKEEIVPISLITKKNFVSIPEFWYDRLKKKLRRHFKPYKAPVVAEKPRVQEVPVPELS